MNVGEEEGRDIVRVLQWATEHTKYVSAFADDGHSERLLEPRRLRDLLLSKMSRQSRFLLGVEPIDNSWPREAVAEARRAMVHK